MTPAIRLAVTLTGLLTLTLAPLGCGEHEDHARRDRLDGDATIVTVLNDDAGAAAKLAQYAQRVASGQYDGHDIAPLLAAAQHRDAKVRLKAVDSLGQRTAFDVRATSVLFELARGDADDAVRKAAASQLVITSK